MLTERQLEIVFAVVYEYIKTGEPVGSRTISRKFLKSHSAATIRNEMSDLEEMGYFTQPHSSAGRLPTSAAYRVYVNSIMHRPSVPPPEFSAWMHAVSDQLASLDERLEQAARFLGRFTRCFSVAAVASLGGLRLRKADFIRISPEVLLVLLVVENGAVRHKQLLISPEISQDNLTEMCTIINNAAVGHLWNDISTELRDFLAGHMRESWKHLLPVFSYIDKTMNGETMRLSTGGVREAFMNDEEDHSDERKNRIEAIGNFMDVRSALEEFINGYTAHEGLTVTIGDENEHPAMQSCSVMMSSATDGRKKAVVGLVGPMRMNYASSIAVLEAVLNGLSLSQDKEE